MNKRDAKKLAYELVLQTIQSHIESGHFKDVQLDPDGAGNTPDKDANKVIAEIEAIHTQLLIKYQKFSDVVV